MNVSGKRRRKKKEKKRQCLVIQLGILSYPNPSRSKNHCSLSLMVALRTLKLDTSVSQVRDFLIHPRLVLMICIPPARVMCLQVFIPATDDEYPNEHTLVLRGID